MGNSPTAPILRKRCLTGDLQIDASLVPADGCSLNPGELWDDGQHG